MVASMITVNHYANGYWSVTGIPIDRNVLAKSLYHYGELKPNYPVPAIQTEVHWNALPANDPFAGLTIRCDGWLVYDYHPINGAEFFDMPSLAEQEAYAKETAHLFD